MENALRFDKTAFFLQVAISSHEDVPGRLLMKLGELGKRLGNRHRVPNQFRLIGVCFR